MKKTRLFFLTVIALLVFVMAFSACQGKDTDNDKEGDDEVTQVTEDIPDIKDGVLTFREGDGVTFSNESLYTTSTAFPKAPTTYETWVNIPTGTTEAVGAVIGDYYNEETPYFILKIIENCVPELYYSNGTKASQKLSIVFDQVSVPTGAWVHLAIVDDTSAGVVNCYINGKLEQSITLSTIRKNTPRNTSGNPAGFGGDARDDNALAFKGSIRSFAAYQTARTADEIVLDMTSINLNDENLIAVYDIAKSQGLETIKDHKGDLDLKNVKLNMSWISPSEVAMPEDFDYSIALIGDTQILSYYYPDSLPSIFDWLIKNKDEHKIEHVLNLGDFTNYNKPYEWELCVNQYFRLNGVIDYTLVRGDHDVLNYGDTSITDPEGMYEKYFRVDAYTDRLKQADSGYKVNITNCFRKVQIGGEDYVILTLDKDPSSVVIKWAKETIEKYSDTKVIMTMHCYLDHDGERLVKNVDQAAPTRVDGEDIWKQIASQYKNVQFVISGHKATDNVVWTKDTGVNGNIVNQVLVNPQDFDNDFEGNTGMICLLYFKKGSDEVQVRYLSSCREMYYRWQNQFTINLSDNSAPTSIEK